MVEGREEEGGGSPAVSAGVLRVLASIWGPKKGSKNTATTGTPIPPMPVTRQKQRFCWHWCWVTSKASLCSSCHWLSVPVSSHPGPHFYCLCSEGGAANILPFSPARGAQKAMAGLSSSALSWGHRLVSSI